MSTRNQSTFGPPSLESGKRTSGSFSGISYGSRKKSSRRVTIANWRRTYDANGTGHGGTYLGSLNISTNSSVTAIDSNLPFWGHISLFENFSFRDSVRQVDVVEAIGQDSESVFVVTVLAHEQKRDIFVDYVIILKSYLRMTPTRVPWEPFTTRRFLSRSICHPLETSACTLKKSWSPFLQIILRGPRHICFRRVIYYCSLL